VVVKDLEERGPEAARGGLIAGDCDVVGARLWGQGYGSLSVCFLLTTTVRV